MASPRVIATDLDGTLLQPNGTISARSQRALTAAVQAGAKLVIVTARPLRATEAIAEQLTCAAVVCGNGAVVQRPDRSELLVRALDPITAETVLGKLRGSMPDLGFGIETDTGFFHDPAYTRGRWIPPEWVTDVLDSTEALVERAVPATKLLARSENTPVHLMHEAAVAAVGPSAEITYSSAGSLLEVSASEVHKGSTLALLCEEWGITAEEVIAFGDMPNDLSSLTWAGSGYAMADGHPGLLDPALGLRTAPPNSDDGVARVVEELFGRR